MPDIQTFLAFSCPHAPLQDDETVRWLMQQIGDRQPDVIVHLGDGHEANAASRWPSEYKWKLSYEYERHNDFLARIRKTAPKARKVFIRGNHDDNLLAENRIPEGYRDLVGDFTRHEPELQHWEQVKKYEYSREGSFRLGSVIFAHGFQAGATADLDHAIKFSTWYNLVNTLYVGGHTHRPIPVTQARKSAAIPLPFWYANAGAIRDIWNVPYMSRKDRSAWGQAIVVGETLVTKSPRLSKTWEAETIVFRMFNEKFGEG